MDPWVTSILIISAFLTVHTFQSGNGEMNSGSSEGQKLIALLSTTV